MRLFALLTATGAVLSGCAPVEYRPPAAPATVYLSGQAPVYVTANQANVYIVSSPAPALGVNDPAAPPPAPVVQATPPPLPAPEAPSLPPPPPDVPSEATIDPGESLGYSITGWTLLGSGAVCAIPAILWRQNEDPQARGASELASDLWAGSGALLVGLGAYFLYQAYQVDQPPSTEVSATVLPGGGAIGMSGSFGGF